MKYPTENFQPIVSIPHEEVIKQLTNLGSYSFPIFQANNNDQVSLEPILRNVFLGEVLRAKEYLQTAKLSDDDRVKRSELLIHKVIHTDYSMSIALELVKRLSDQITNKQAILIMFLHDIGRFPELCQEGINRKHHADLSAEIVNREYLANEDFKTIIDKSLDIIELLQALREHSNAYYEGGNIFAKFVRDTDKIAIIGETVEQVNRLHKTQIGTENNTLSPNVKKSYVEKRIVFNEDRKTKADALLSLMAFISHLHFKQSLNFCIERNLNNFLHQNFINMVLNIDKDLENIVKQELQIS